MKILLIGRNGQLGWELARALPVLGEVAAPRRDELDLADCDEIRRKIREMKPELIVNAAAYTAVDGAEDEPELVQAINATAPAVMAQEAADLGAALVHYSTDYVFDGTKPSAYEETDQPAPINAYGRSKLAGEERVMASGAAAIVLRVGWIYAMRRDNFALTILRRVQQGAMLRVVDDQIGAPTWARAAAMATLAIIVRCHETSSRPADGFSAVRGVYHLGSAGSTSRFGFAQALIERLMPPSKVGSADARLAPVHSGEYALRAARPLNSVLLSERAAKLFGVRLPHWCMQLDMALDDAGAVQAPFT